MAASRGSRQALAVGRASRQRSQVVADMGNAETVVIPVKLGLTGLDVRHGRVPGHDLVWSEDEWSPAAGNGSDGFSVPSLEASLIH